MSLHNTTIFIFSEYISEKRNSHKTSEPLENTIKDKTALICTSTIFTFKRDFGKRNRQEMLVPLQNKINKEKLATEKLIIMQTVNQFKLLELCESNFSVSYTSIMRFFSADVPIYLN